MIIKFKKVVDDPAGDVQLPAYATDAASGFDLAASEDVMLGPGETHLVPTGLAVELPRVGMVLYELQVRPRGGVSLKQGLLIANSPGTVDVDYRGEVKIIVRNMNSEPYLIKKGMRIAQGVICPAVRCHLVWAEELGETARGAGGFGSTGMMTEGGDGEV